MTATFSIRPHLRFPKTHWGLLLGCLCACQSLPASSSPFRVDAISAPTRKTIWHERNPKSVKLRFADEEFATLEFAGTPRPFIYPLYAPGSIPVTRSWPQEERPGEAHDHIHHTSLWFAHGDVNGVDFWHPQSENGGVIEYTGRLNELLPRGKRLRTRHKYQWKDKDGEVLLLERRTHLFGAEHDLRWVDLKIELTAAQDKVVFGDTKEGTMALRLHPALRVNGKLATGSILNSEGDKNGKAWGKRAQWIHYSGTIESQPVGVAVFDHPENLSHPTWWHAREYGLVAANPFGRRAFTNAEAEPGQHILENEDTLVLRYRVWLHSDERSAKEIQQAYEAYLIQSKEM